LTWSVRRVELREIRLPLREPFRISSGVESERRILLVELLERQGASVWAECVAGAAPNYSPETIDTAWLVLREWLAPRLLAATWSRAAEVHGLLAESFRGHRMARAVLEMGCWGLEAVSRGVSLSKLLGGERERVATGISLGIQARPEALAEKALAARAEGYRKIKLKIRPGSDLDYVRAVRQALGEQAVLAVDANSAYTLDDLSTFEALDGLGLLMIEQPLGASDLVRHARLQRTLSTPLCLDESITGRERAEDMLELGSGRIVNIKPGRVGGFAESTAIHRLGVEHGLPVWCGGMLESGIGRAYNVALASLPGFVLPGDLSPSARYWHEDVVEPEWTMSADGLVDVPHDRPGLGVEVRRDRLEALTVRKEALTA
jgi:O-succinylbenzoate synthase